MLRTDLGLTGTKYGCGESLCGACTVVVDGEAVRSCQAAGEGRARQGGHHDRGAGEGGKLHPLQEAFAEVGGLPCGFRAPGMIMNAYALLLRTPKPDRGQMQSGMDGNLYRCAAHQRIVKAIERASALA